MNMNDFNLQVGPVLQEQCAYCGPASALMVLQTGLLLGQTQDSIMKDILKSPPMKPFVTTPEALKNILEMHLGGVFTIDLTPVNDLEKSIKIIANSLLSGRLPALALTLGCGHWVTVGGFRHNNDFNDLGIGGLLVCDPDNMCLDCDMDGMIAPMCSRNSVQPLVEFLSIKDWKSRLTGGCSLGGASQCVSVVRGAGEIGAWKSFKLLEQPESIAGEFSRSQIEESLWAGIEFFGLEDSDSFRGSIRGSSVGEIVRVFYGRGQESYALVELRGEGGVRAVARVGVDNGEFLGMRVMQKPLDRFVSSEESMVDLFEIVQERMKDSGRLPTIEPFNREARFTWEPLHQFRSPYNPFIIHADGLYQGLNGVLYRRVWPASA